MNCEIAQRRLLNADCAEEPSAETCRHLAECPSCRVWQRQLAQLDQRLPQLPVPPSQRKADVLRLLLNAPEPAPLNGTAPIFAPIRPFTPSPRERGLRKASLAIALAAGLAVFALGWWAWPQTTVRPDPLASLRLERDQLLAQAPTRQAKVERLATLADRKHQEALTLAQQGEADKLANTARFYIELVRDDLPGHARQLSPVQRLEALGPIIDQLADTANAIDSLLAKPIQLSGRTRDDLQQMARATRDSRDLLLALKGGDA